MAVTIPAPLPAVANFTLGAANVCTQVTVPPGATRMSIKPRAGAAKLALSSALADGGALGAVHYIELAADQMYDLRIAGLRKTRGDGASVFVACAAGGVVVEVLVEGGAS